jgi:SAM-dependent methyltransferase
MAIASTIKEEEIRPDDLFQEFMALSAQDAEAFFQEDEFEVVACQACGSYDQTDRGFKKFSFTYAHCNECGTLYVSPRPTDKALLRYYAESESQRFWSDVILKQTGEKRKKSIVLPALERIVNILQTLPLHHPKRILDVGSGNGAFLAEWKSLYPDAELFGIEPGMESAQKCRDLGITVYESFVEDEAEKGQAQGDLVTCFEVLEHVQNLERFTKAVCKVTAPEGVAIFSCLGIDGFDVQLLWEKSRAIMPPYHLNFLSNKGMEKAFSNAGFKSVEILTPGRLDVDIVLKSIDRGVDIEMSRFERLILSRGEKTLKAFQKFLAENSLSSHVWIVCKK